MRDHDQARRLARLAEQRREMPIDTDDPTLLQPPVTLYAPRSEESWHAFELLASAGIRFRVVVSPRQKHPSADWDCLRFTGLDGIKDLVARAHELEEVALIDDRSPTLAPPDPRLKSLMASLHERQLEEARAALLAVWQPSPTPTGPPKPPRL